jgi:hypothetical protein
MQSINADMRDILGWLEQNKTWLFSGIGVLGLTVIGGIIRWFRRKPPATWQQSQQAGASSSNLQAGRDINLSISTPFQASVTLGATSEISRSQSRHQKANAVVSLLEEGKTLLGQAPNNGTPPERRTYGQPKLKNG